MKLQIDATPEELVEKADSLVESIGEFLRPIAPDISEILEKALPRKESELKFPVLRELQKRTEVLYEQQLEAMLKDIGKVLNQSKTKKSLDDSDLEKAGPYIGPKGGKWADPQHTIPWHENTGSSGHIQKLQDHLKEKYGIKVRLYGRGDHMELGQIVVPKDRRNEGVGTKAMKTILAFADMNKKTISLSPSTDFGGTKSKLIKFYKRLGFVENKGRNKDYEISEAMYRLPKIQKSEDSPDYTEKLIEKEEDKYEQVKKVLIGKGYVESDFEPGGPLHGYSTNQLIELVRDKRDD
jgi:predicted GNAT family N-acyltransferase